MEYTSHVVVDEFILPAQFFTPQSTTKLYGIAGLCLALVEDAYANICRFLQGKAKTFGVYKPGRIRAARAFLETLTWIDGADSTITFAEACQISQLSDDLIRAHIKAMIRRAWRDGNPALTSLAHFSPDRGQYGGFDEPFTGPHGTPLPRYEAGVALSTTPD